MGEKCHQSRSRMWRCRGRLKRVIKTIKLRMKKSVSSLAVHGTLFPTFLRCCFHLNIKNVSQLRIFVLKSKKYHRLPWSWICWCIFYDDLAIPPIRLIFWLHRNEPSNKSRCFKTRISCLQVRVSWLYQSMSQINATMLLKNDQYSLDLLRSWEFEWSLFTEIICLVSASIWILVLLCCFRPCTHSKTRSVHFIKIYELIKCVTPVRIVRNMRVFGNVFRILRIMHARTALRFTQLAICDQLSCKYLSMTVFFYIL